MSIEANVNITRYVIIALAMVHPCDYIYLLATFDKSPKVKIRRQLLVLMATCGVTFVWMVVRRVVSMYHARPSLSEGDRLKCSWRTFGVAYKTVFTLCLGVAMAHITITVLSGKLGMNYSVSPIEMPTMATTTNPKDMLKCGKMGSLRRVFAI